MAYGSIPRLAQANAGPLNSTSPVIQIYGLGGGDSTHSVGARQTGVLIGNGAEVSATTGTVSVIGGSGYATADVSTGQGDIHGVSIQSGSIQTAGNITIIGEIQGSTGTGNSAVLLATPALSSSSGSISVQGIVPSGSLDTGIEIVGDPTFVLPLITAPSGGLFFLPVN